MARSQSRRSRIHRRQRRSHVPSAGKRHSWFQNSALLAGHAAYTPNIRSRLHASYWVHVNRREKSPWGSWGVGPERWPIISAKQEIQERLEKRTAERTPKEEGRIWKNAWDFSAP